MPGKAHVTAIVVLTLCFTMSPRTPIAAEQSVTVMPAKFVEGEKSLRNLINHPSVDGDYVVILSCFADVSIRGRMSHTVCSYQDESALMFSKAVERAGKRARLSPAILNGEKKKIWLQFTAIFLKDIEGEDIQIFNNVRENVDRYGDEYIGAQRIDWFDFPKTCRQFYDWFALARVNIAVDGSPRDFEWEPSSTNMPNGCEDTLKILMLTSNYIPAFYQGKPVDSTYAEPWFTNRHIR